MPIFAAVVSEACPMGLTGGEQVDSKGFDDGANKQPYQRRLEDHTVVPSISKLTILYNIVISHGDRNISIPVVLGSECQESLILEKVDVQRLGLERTSIRPIQYPDGSVGQCEVFEKVAVSLIISDGSRVEMSIAPIYLIPDDSAPLVVGVECSVRILGVPAIDWLNLKSDYRNRKLIKRIRRI